MLLTFAVLASACSSAPAPVGQAAPDRPTGDLVDSTGANFVVAPQIPTGDLSPEIRQALDEAFEPLELGRVGPEAMTTIGESGDVRLAWLMTDLMRFVPAPPGSTIANTYEALTGLPVIDEYGWKEATDALIAWDVPAPPDYVRWKRLPFELVDDRWAPFFDDEDSAIDWRLYSWGGVRIDDRPRDEVDDTCRLGCIPAINDPALTDAAGGDWYDDNAVVFGVAVGDEAVAFPKNIMEVHEMVNTTIGGRRVAIPYCTLCGSAQAYVTDNVDGFDTLEIRTSGLLARSNKVMFDLDSFSVFDTFTGEALSGPLHDAGVQLEQLTVVTSSWADWKAAYPGTSIVAEDGGLGRSYPSDPLRGRDDNGPIFPVGDVDPRLGVQASVVGVISPGGQPIAFPAEAVRAAIDAGETPGLDGVTIVADAGGFRAEDVDGNALAAHEAFWFAWSQFHEDTLVWSPTTE